jgi:hypothetical protein
MTENEGFDQQEEMAEDSPAPIESDDAGEAPSKSGSELRVMLLLVLLLAVAAVAGYFYLGGLTLSSPPPKTVSAPIPVPSKLPAAALLPPVSQPAAQPPAAQPQPALPAEAAHSSVPVPVKPVAATKFTATAKSAETAKPLGTGNVPDAAKPAVTAKTADTSNSPAASGAGYTLEAGAFVFGSNLEIAKRSVQKLGFDPQVTVTHRPVEMTRLLVGSYPPVEARAKLAELIGQAAPGAFAIAGKSQWAIYAASFLSSEHAEMFSKRLEKQGIVTSKEKISVNMPLSLLSFGTFATRQGAKAIAAKARGLHLEVFVAQHR